MSDSDFTSICSLEEAKSIYQQLCDQEDTLTREIDLKLKEAETFEDKIRRIKHSLPDPNLVKSDAEDLKRSLQYTCDLSATVSNRIRKIDLIKQRVADCLQRVGDIADLKKCTDGIQSALDNEEYENAALIVQRFLKIDEHQIRSSNNMEGTTLDDAFSKLNEAKRKLLQMSLKEFDAAVDRNDVASVERFFKLFPFLNQQKEGLVKFSCYLSSKITPMEDEVKSRITTHTPSHADQLGTLFQIVAKIIDIHQPLVETYYRPGNLLYVVEVLQKECDKRVTIIFSDFKNKKNLSTLESVIHKGNKQSTWSTAQLPKFDPRELDSILTEIVLVSSRGETYSRFIQKRIKEDFNVAYPDPKSKERKEAESQLLQLINNSGLSRLMQDMSGLYVLIEEHFLRESVVKAIELDEADLANSASIGDTLTSSMLDDVFFIIKKCLRRAISLGNVDVVCAIINHSITVLETVYCVCLSDRTRYFPNSMAAVAAALDIGQAYNALQSGGYLQSSSDQEKTKRLFLAAVNNLDMSVQCINTLGNNVKDDASNSQFMSDLDKTQQGKLNSCLVDLKSVTIRFQALNHKGLTQLYVSLLKPLIKLWVESLDNEENHMSERDFCETERTEGMRPFTSSFLLEMDTIFKVLKQQLTSSNFDKLVLIFSGDLATRVDKAILKCSFNKLGSHQLDREVRSILSYVSSLTSVSVRDKFHRLKQIVLLLNVDSVEEVVDTFGPEGQSSPGNRLSVPDIRSYLKLREDLSRDDIRKMKL